MQIIQHVALIEATINPSNRRITLSKDILRGKKIQALYIFSGDEDFNQKYPNSENFIYQLGEIDNLNLYLNMTDVNGNHFIKDYSFSNFTISTASANFIEFDINRILDLNKCTISFKGDTDTVLKLLIYVLYQTHNYTTFNDTVNGSITVELPTTPSDVLLSKLINQTLKGKRIHKIIVSPTTASKNGLMGYLDLVCRNNRIENLPLTFLLDRSPKEFYFDDVEIDFEKSYFRNRDMDPLHRAITRLTFIY